MKKEHISDALNMLNDDIIEETNKVRANAKPTRKWVKWGAVAACLCLAVTIAIPMLHHKGGPGTQDPVQNIAALEYNGKFTRLSNFRRCLRSMVCRLKSPPIWLASTFPT